MDYEKAYKEALEKAKKELSICGSMDCDAAKQIFRFFPELKMNEDERIRKALIENFKFYGGDFLKTSKWGKNDDLLVTDIIAWLEKQAEPQPYRGNADTMRKNLIKAFKSVGSKHWGGFDVRDIIHFLESKDAIELEKQGEQKPVDSYCKEHCKGFQETGKCYADGECKAKREAEQNPAWSEECNAKIKRLKDYIVKHKGFTEETMKMLDIINSIKPQPHWKPTDEQLQTLEETIEYDAADANVVVLRSLINDLKKL